jgi:hypothetical protein
MQDHDKSYYHLFRYTQLTASLHNHTRHLLSSSDSIPGTGTGNSTALIITTSETYPSPIQWLSRSLFLNTRRRLKLIICLHIILEIMTHILMLIYFILYTLTLIFNVWCGEKAVNQHHGLRNTEHIWDVFTICLSESVELYISIHYSLSNCDA